MPALPSVSLSLCVFWRRDILPEGEEGWTVTVERCEIQTLVNEQRSTAKSPHLIITSRFSNLCLHPASVYLSPFVSVFLFVCLLFPPVCLHLGPSLFKSSFSLHLLLCCSLPPSCMPHVLSFLFLLPLFIAPNPSTCAASGTRRTTQSPGPSSTQPTSTR